MDVWFEVEPFAAWLQQFGVWAVAVSLLLSIIISIAGVIPSLFLSGANAVVFGMFPGFAVSLIGEVAGAGISFYLYRWGVHKIKPLRADRWKWLQGVNEASRGRRMTMLLIARLTPIIPSGAITFVGAASRMKFVDFIVVTFLGKAPSIALETVIGHDLIYLDENLPRLLVSFVFVALILLLFRNRKSKQSRQESGNNRD